MPTSHRDHGDALTASLLRRASSNLSTPEPILIHIPQTNKYSLLLPDLSQTGASNRASSASSDGRRAARTQRDNDVALSRTDNPRMRFVPLKAWELDSDSLTLHDDEVWLKARLQAPTEDDRKALVAAAPPKRTEAKAASRSGAAKTPVKSARSKLSVGHDGEGTSNSKRVSRVTNHAAGRTSKSNKTKETLKRHARVVKSASAKTVRIRKSNKRLRTVDFKPPTKASRPPRLQLEEPKASRPCRSAPAVAISAITYPAFTALKSILKPEKMPRRRHAKCVSFVDEVVGSKLHSLRVYHCSCRKNMWFRFDELSFFSTQLGLRQMEEYTA